MSGNFELTQMWQPWFFNSGFSRQAQQLFEKKDNLKVHSHTALALAATLQIGFKPHSLCSVNVAANANAVCE